jgi:poly(3-hydroxybutyrate) depolymerase
MQIHGVQDTTVPYFGSGWSKSIKDVIDFWVAYNSCNNEPERIIKYSNQYGLINFDTYEGCLNNVNVKLILHPEMGHNWPYIQNYNIDASQEVWDFVSKYNLYGLIN